MKFLIINGPNLNLLGLREPAIYGSKDYNALISFIKASCDALGIECETYQSNHEGAIVDKIQEAYGVFDGIVINPAAYTHTSVAIHDALKAVSIPTVEVHLSDINSREEFRRHSFVSPIAVKTICGLGFDGYKEAIIHLKNHLENS
jgi:3-dehydroquinate dehydratase-2